MEYLIGVGLAVVVCAFAMLVGFDRERVFYPTLVTVIATYYILFAVIGSSKLALALESLIAGAFLGLDARLVTAITRRRGGGVGIRESEASGTNLRRMFGVRRYPIAPMLRPQMERPSKNRRPW